jgi:hypothetical protein
MYHIAMVDLNYLTNGDTFSESRMETTRKADSDGCIAWHDHQV